MMVRDVVRKIPRKVQVEAFKVLGKQFSEFIFYVSDYHLLSVLVFFGNWKIVQFARKIFQSVPYLEKRPQQRHVFVYLLEY